jgi:hypothetical protein
VRNRQFLKPFEPLKPDSHYTLERQKEVIEKVQHNWENGSGYGVGIFLNSDDQSAAFLAQEEGCILFISCTIRFAFTTKAVRYACIRMPNRPRYFALVKPWCLLSSAFLCSIMGVVAECVI